jgi:hypothetical protein
MAKVITYYKVVEYNLQANPIVSSVLGRYSSIEEARKQLEAIKFTYRFRNPTQSGDKLYIKKPHGYVRGWKIEKGYSLDTSEDRKGL